MHYVLGLQTQNSKHSTEILWFWLALVCVLGWRLGFSTLFDLGLGFGTLFDLGLGFGTPFDLGFGFGFGTLFDLGLGLTRFLVSSSKVSRRDRPPSNYFCQNIHQFALRICVLKEGRGVEGGSSHFLGRKSLKKSTTWASTTSKEPYRVFRKRVALLR